MPPSKTLKGCLEINNFSWTRIDSRLAYVKGHIAHESDGEDPLDPLGSSVRAPATISST